MRSPAIRREDRERYRGTYYHAKRRLSRRVQRVKAEVRAAMPHPVFAVLWWVVRTINRFAAERGEPNG